LGTKTWKSNKKVKDACLCFVDLASVAQHYLSLACVVHKMAVETASKLTYIKHNLILEHPDLFNIARRQETETPEEEIINGIAADDIIIEDC
jgi:hypothetical protein